MDLFTLLSDLKLLLAAQHYSLEHFVRTDVGLERLGIPQFPYQFAKSLIEKNQFVSWRALDMSVVLFTQKVVPQRWNVR